MADIEVSEATGSIDDLLASARAEAESEAASSDEKPTRQRRTRKPSAPRSGSKKSLKEPLTDFYTTIGTAVFMLNQADGQVILANAESMAASLDKWADANPAVRKALERLTSTSAMGGVIAAHAPVVLAILNNHDVISSIMGTKNADKNSDSETGTETTDRFATGEHPGSYMGSGGRITPVIVEAG